MATPNYDINYNDERFQKVETAKTNALNEVDETYGNMIGDVDSFYNKMIAESEKYAEEQTKIQNEKTDLAIEQIEQQKAQTKKDYIKEQSGAYVDWQKQSGQYGANAEAMAAQGLAQSGYSESSQVSMYNTYQNRVATARESYNRAVLNYDNAIKDARLQNNAALAEIAYNALQKQLELSLEGFQYKNSLIIEQSNKKMEVDNNYYNRYQDVLSQINTENAMAEEVRQFNANLAEDQRQFNASHSLAQAKFNYEKAQDAAAAAAAQVDKPKGGSIKYGTSDPDLNKQMVSNIKKQATPKDKALAEIGGAATAEKYINELINSGASKDKVSNEISLALARGAIGQVEATRLRNKFTPRGIQY